MSIWAHHNLCLNCFQIKIIFPFNFIPINIRLFNKFSATCKRYFSNNVVLGVYSLNNISVAKLQSINYLTLLKFKIRSILLRLAPAISGHLKKEMTISWHFVSKYHVHLHKVLLRQLVTYFHLDHSHTIIELFPSVFIHTYSLLGNLAQLLEPSNSID